LARMTRKTIAFSRSQRMVQLTMELFGVLSF
jgi:IS1 family transposase